MAFDRNKTIYAGMQTSALQQMLTQAQQAYAQLSSGTQAVTLSYAQGDGAKTVTYSQTNIAQLTAHIRGLQAQLGVISKPRRAMRFKF